MGANGNGSRALVNMAIICQTLLENNGLSDAAKSEVRALLDEWRRVAVGSDAGADTELAQSAEALLARMEAFVRERAVQPVVAH